MNSDSTTLVSLAEGKTKIIWPLNEEHVRVVSKDDITAGDGKKHDVIEGKGKLSNQTTCNVFRLLKDCGLPVAFVKQSGDNEFIAERCTMIPYEVVIRREAHGSYLKRNPYLAKGHIFPQLKLEFFLKTSGKKWGNYDLPVDDPMVIFDGGRVFLYRPDQPIHQQTPFLVLEDFPLKDHPEEIEKICQIALKNFLVSEKAWQLLGRKLVDLKVEFGHNTENELRLADVIDNDSWRVLEDGKYIDKQIYRDGADLNEVISRYQLVAELTGRFGLPCQQIILWRGSESDDLEPFHKAISEYNLGETCRVKSITCSAHKQPVQVCEQAAQLLQEFPDTVIIAYVGRSNGLGPILSAQVSVPVISVSSTWTGFPQDVWSSLHLPSSVPVATILDPKNAVLFALQILAMRNPRLYAELRIKKEKRLGNIVRI
jgi:phosphoribosylaminoimidazole carboxylase/phosphoribosylaminoimidazole-succinocarboxamide synthase